MSRSFQCVFVCSCNMLFVCLWRQHILHNLSSDPHTHTHTRITAGAKPDLQMVQTHTHTHSRGESLILSYELWVKHIVPESPLSRQTKSDRSSGFPVAVCVCVTRVTCPQRRHGNDNNKVLLFPGDPAECVCGVSGRHGDGGRPRGKPLTCSVTGRRAPHLCERRHADTLMFGRKHA